MAIDRILDERARSEFDAAAQGDFVQSIVRLLTDTIGHGPSSFSADEQRTMTDVVTLLTQISQTLLGISKPSPRSYIEGGLYTAGGFTVRRTDIGRVEQVRGSGEVLTSAAEQFAVHADTARYRRTAVGTIDTFDGMSQELVSGMYGQIIAERGLRAGNVLGTYTGTTPEEMAEQLEKLERAGATAGNAGYDELNKTYAVLSKLAEVAELSYGKAYNELSAGEKASVVEALRRDRDAYGAYVGRNGKEYTASDITESDLDVAQGVASRGRYATVVSDAALADIDKTAEAVAKNLQAWSDILETQDIGTLQATASRLKIKSITTAEGTAQLGEAIKDIYTYAELSGKEVRDVLEGYSAIASALDVSGKIYSTAQLSELYGNAEQFAHEEATGRAGTPHSASTRAEMTRQRQVNRMNNMMGVLAARYGTAQGMFTEAQQEEMARLTEEYNSAIANNDLERADNVNWRLAELAQAAGIDLSDKDVQKKVLEQHTEADTRATAAAEVHSRAALRARNVRLQGASVSAEDRAALVGMYEDMITELGGQRSHAIAKVVRALNPGASAEDARKAIEESSDLTDAQRQFALKYMHMFGTDDTARRKFADAAVAAYQDATYANLADTTRPALEDAERMARREQVSRNLEEGIYRKDADVLSLFTDALLHGDTMTGKQGTSVVSKTKALLQSEDVAEQIEGLLQLKDSSGQDFITGDSIEARKKKAKELLKAHGGEVTEAVRKAFSAEGTVSGKQEAPDGKREGPASVPEAPTGIDGGTGDDIRKLVEILGTLRQDVQTIINRMN